MNTALLHYIAVSRMQFDVYGTSPDMDEIRARVAADGSFGDALAEFDVNWEGGASKYTTLLAVDIAVGASKWYMAKALTAAEA